MGGGFRGRGAIPLHRAVISSDLQDIRNNSYGPAVHRFAVWFLSENLRSCESHTRTHARTHQRGEAQVCCRAAERVNSSDLDLLVARRDVVGHIRAIESPCETLAIGSVEAERASYNTANKEE